ncbi:hypothetical protein BGW42_004499 [Actinomortierella wolfii]|nr:hypothetical protein BGW42_004499 [Actinomortierella wolfii]
MIQHPQHNEDKAQLDTKLEEISISPVQVALRTSVITADDEHGIFPPHSSRIKRCGTSSHITHTTRDNKGLYNTQSHPNPVRNTALNDCSVTQPQPQPQPQSQPQQPLPLYPLPHRPTRNPNKVKSCPSVSRLSITTPTIPTPITTTTTTHSSIPKQDSADVLIDMPPSLHFPPSPGQDGQLPYIKPPPITPTTTLSSSAGKIFFGTNDEYEERKISTTNDDGNDDGSSVSVVIQKSAPVSIPNYPLPPPPLRSTLTFSSSPSIRPPPPPPSIQLPHHLKNESTCIPIASPTTPTNVITSTTTSTSSSSSPNVHTTPDSSASALPTFLQNNDNNNNTGETHAHANALNVSSSLQRFRTKLMLSTDTTSLWKSATGPRQRRATIDSPTPLQGIVVESLKTPQPVENLEGLSQEEQQQHQQQPSRFEWRLDHPSSLLVGFSAPTAPSSSDDYAATAAASVGSMQGWLAGRPRAMSTGAIPSPKIEPSERDQWPHTFTPLEVRLPSTSTLISSSLLFKHCDEWQEQRSIGTSTTTVTAAAAAAAAAAAVVVASTTVAMMTPGKDVPATSDKPAASNVHCQAKESNSNDDDEDSDMYTDTEFETDEGEDESNSDHQPTSRNHGGGANTTLTTNTTTSRCDGNGNSGTGPSSSIRSPVEPDECDSPPSVYVDVAESLRTSISTSSPPLSPSSSSPVSATPSSSSSHPSSRRSIASFCSRVYTSLSAAYFFGGGSSESPVHRRHSLQSDRSSSSTSSRSTWPRRSSGKKRSNQRQRRLEKSRAIDTSIHQDRPHVAKDDKDDDKATWSSQQRNEIRSTPSSPALTLDRRRSDRSGRLSSLWHYATGSSSLFMASHGGGHDDDGGGGGRGSGSSGGERKHCRGLSASSAAFFGSTCSGAGSTLGLRQRSKAIAKAFDQKAQFSNERTYLHWITFGMLLGSMALTLLSFGDREIGNRIGLFLVLVAMATLVYATVLFHCRDQWMRQCRVDRQYYDRIGPTILFTALFVAYVANVVLTMYQISEEIEHNRQNFYGNRRDPVDI